MSDTRNRAHITEQRMSDDLRQIVNDLTPLQRSYAEYRAKGFKQADAAKRAGSEAADRAKLNRVGWQLEQIPGVKAYLAFLYETRARAMALDDTEVIEKLREIYLEAMYEKRFSDAVKATELLGLFLGMFNRNNGTKNPNTSAEHHKNALNTEAFKTEDTTPEDESVEERVHRIAKLISQVNRSPTIALDKDKD